MRLLRYIVATIAPAMLFAACDSSKDHEENEPDYPPVLPKNYYVSPSCTGGLVSVSAAGGHGVDSVLGAGYDVTGAYLSPSSIRGMVMDVSKMAKDAITHFSATASSSGDVYDGESAGNFLGNLMSVFDMSVSSSDPMYCFVGTLTESGRTNDQYVMRQVWNRLTISRFNTLSHRLYKALSDDFKRDLTVMSPDGLVGKYGTHIICRARMGLSIRQVYHTYAFGDEASRKAWHGFNATLEKVSNGHSWSALSDVYGRIGIFGSTLSMEFCGGNPSAVSYDPVTGNMGNLDAWNKSVNNENSALVSLDDEDLIPLQAAIEDESLRVAVGEAVVRYVRESSRQMWKRVTLPLFQNSDGKQYRYVSSEELARQLWKDGITLCGIVGAVYVNEIPATVALYSNETANGHFRLSLERGADWSRLGYVYTEPSADRITLQEITDGTRYAYTIEEGDTFGKSAEWRVTGVKFYLPRP